MRPDAFHLSQAETNTDTWRRLKAHAETRLANLRRDAENLGKTEAERRDLMVRIDELKKFLALGNPPAPDKPANAGY